MSLFARHFLPTLSKFCHPAAWVTLSLAAASSSWAQSDAPKFKDYAGNPAFSGTPAPTQLLTDGDRTFRTRLRAASAQPANFAGDHVLTTWGCGTNCLYGAAVSLRTGRVTFLPGSVCCWNGDGNKISIRPDSRLLVTAGLMNESGDYGAHFYEFTGNSFRHVKTTPLVDPGLGGTAAPARPAPASPVRAVRSAPADTRDSWIAIAESQDSLWQVQPGSLNFGNNKNGTAIASVVGKITAKRSQKIDLHKWYVSGSDCRSKMGKLVTLKIDGSFSHENDFVFGSGSVASAMAETICGAAMRQAGKANEGKGL